MTRNLNRVRCVLFWLSLCLVLYWAVDDAPPYEVMQYTATNGKPGERVTVDGAVKRDLSRPCTVSVRRYIVDSTGAEYESQRQTLDLEAARERERTMPGRVKFAATLPMMIHPGTARHVVALAYTCNPLHYIFPIKMQVQYQFEVLPP